MAGSKPRAGYGPMVKLTIAFPRYAIDVLGPEHARPLIREMVVARVDEMIRADVCAPDPDTSDAA